LFNENRKLLELTAKMAFGLLNNNRALDLKGYLAA